MYQPQYQTRDEDKELKQLIENILYKKPLDEVTIRKYIDERCTQDTCIWPKIITSGRLPEIPLDLVTKERLLRRIGPWYNNTAIAHIIQQDRSKYPEPLQDRINKVATPENLCIKAGTPNILFQAYDHGNLGRVPKHLKTQENFMTPDEHGRTIVDFIFKKENLDPELLPFVTPQDLLQVKHHPGSGVPFRNK